MQDESLTDTKVRSWPGDAAFFLKVRDSGWKYTSPQNRRACRQAGTSYRTQYSILQHTKGL